MGRRFTSGGIFALIYQDGQDQHQIGFPINIFQYNSYGALTDSQLANAAEELANRLAPLCAPSVQFIAGKLYSVATLSNGKQNRVAQREFSFTAVAGSQTGQTASKSATVGFVYKGLDNTAGNPQRNINHTLKLFVGHRKYLVAGKKYVLRSDFTEIATALDSVAGGFNAGYNANGQLNLNTSRMPVQSNAKAQKTLGS